MTAPQSPAFDPRDVEESNATGYPEPFRPANLNRYNRHLGNHAGLQNYGVVMTRIVPGGQSSHRHAHSRPDEFVYVLEGEVTLETNAGEQILSAGMCAGFPAGTGDAHRFINHASADGNFPLLAASVVTMAVAVVLLNRSFWRQLYRLAEQRFSLTGGS